MIKLVLLSLLVLSHQCSAGFWGAVRDNLMGVATAVVPDAEPQSVAEIRPSLYLFDHNFAGAREKIAWTGCKDHSALLFSSDMCDTVDRNAAWKLRGASSITVVIHGLNGGITNSEWLQLMIDNLLKIKRKQFGDYVLFLDWNTGAKSHTLRKYGPAAANTKTVGDWLAQTLKRDFQVDRSRTQLHCIGFSLGAHVCGVAGNALGRNRWHRVSGLDPPKERFMDKEDARRLDVTDGDFVDVYMTTTMALDDGRIGDVKMLLNNANRGLGNIQPGCEASSMDGGACAHRQAALFYAASMANNADCHYSRKLYTYIGYWAGSRSKSLRGNYCIRTLSKDNGHCLQHGNEDC